VSGNAGPISAANSQAYPSWNCGTSDTRPRSKLKKQNRSGGLNVLGLMASLLLVTRSPRRGYKMIDGIVSSVMRTIEPSAKRSLEAVFLFSLLGLTLTLAFSRLAVI
jgi:hypothetical protein